MIPFRNQEQARPTPVRVRQKQRRSLPPQCRLRIEILRKGEEVPQSARKIFRQRHHRVAQALLLPELVLRQTQVPKGGRRASSTLESTPGSPSHAPASPRQTAA